MHPTTELIARRFDTLAPDYDDRSSTRVQYLNAIDNVIVGLINESPVDSPAILDVGTGTGTRIEALRTRLSNGSAIMACDVSPAMVEIARNKNIDDVQVADMTELPYSNEQFDYLLCLFGAFGYLATEEQRVAALSEFARVLKPNGTVVIDVINRWHRGEGIAFRKTIPQILGELSISLVRPSLRFGDVVFESQVGGNSVAGFFHTFTDREVRGLAFSSGLGVADFRVIGYETGRQHTKAHKGNFMYALTKSVPVDLY